jgi:hypothetical protein
MQNKSVHTEWSPCDGSTCCSQFRHEQRKGKKQGKELWATRDPKGVFIGRKKVLYRRALVHDDCSKSRRNKCDELEGVAKQAHTWQVCCQIDTNTLEFPLHT